MLYCFKNVNIFHDDENILPGTKFWADRDYAAMPVWSKVYSCGVGPAWIGRLGSQSKNWNLFN